MPERQLFSKLGCNQCQGNPALRMLSDTLARSRRLVYTHWPFYIVKSILDFVAFIASGASKEECASPLPSLDIKHKKSPRSIFWCS